MKNKVVVVGIGAAIVGVVGATLYVVPALLFIYRSNQVIEKVANQRPASRGEFNNLCAFVSDEVSSDTVSHLWDCVNNVFLHPVLQTTAYEMSPKAEPNTAREIGVQSVLPRRNIGPLTLTVVRDLAFPGNSYKVVFKPGTNVQKGIEFVLQRDAMVRVRLRYMCAMPFTSCERYEDFVTLR
jgi:hypothetical protein